MSVLPLLPVKRIIQNSTNMRVSQDAGEALREILEKKGGDISLLALRFAKAAGRKTVVAEDVDKAIQTISQHNM